MMATEGGGFGFTAKQYPLPRYEENDDAWYEDGFFVELPHQCDEWVIDGGTDPQVVLEKFNAFIDEAVALRDRLVREGWPREEAG